MDRVLIKSSEDIGKLLRDRRMALSLDQETVASLSGVAQSNLSRIERGLTPATLDTYLKLTRVLGIEIYGEPRR